MMSDKKITAKRPQKTAAKKIVDIMNINILMSVILLKKSGVCKN